MPDKDGVETIRELRASALKIPIICITGGSSYRDVTGVHSCDFWRMIRMFGATQTIAKPFKTGELLAAVQKCLSTSEEAEH